MKPKPVKAWAAFDPSGKIHPEYVSDSRQDAWWEVENGESGGWGLTRPELYQQGWRVRKVEIREIK